MKRPGEINGQQFIIKNCTKSKIYLFDHMSTLTIDDCSDCLFVCGPVKGRFETVLDFVFAYIFSWHENFVIYLLTFASSIFLRDSNNCTLVCASSQLRLRDCRNVNLYVGCESEPIIEASTNIVTAPYYLNYKGMNGKLVNNIPLQNFNTLGIFLITLKFYCTHTDHFESAQLSWLKAIHWSNIYDYTPNQDVPNWNRYNKLTQKPEKFICPPLPMHSYTDINMSVNQLHSLVPVTEHFDPADTYGGLDLWTKQEKVFKLTSGNNNNNNAKSIDEIRTFYEGIVNSEDKKKLVQVQMKSSPYQQCVFTYFSHR